MENIGRPVKIVDYGENKELVLNEQALKDILLHHKALNKKVCVISITGAFRKGKSFLLNFFIKFFENEGNKEWLNESDTITGFHWRCGSDRDTTGIFMWSEPFIVCTRQMEHVAVFLMDTQGAFDTHATVKECATLFSLSLMISSMQIYNIPQNIQEDNLQHLQLFADYGRLALQETKTQPFQFLLFLIRDWPYNYECKYGYAGGSELLEKRLNPRKDSDKELRDTRKFIQECFKMIKCFLMPHPGQEASNSNKFSGKISELDNDFKTQIKYLIEGLFHEKSFQIKEINGQQITSTQLFEYFNTYCSVFSSNELPAPSTLLRATAEANNLAAKVAAKEFYLNAMNAQLGSGVWPLTSESFENLHREARRKSIEIFHSFKKMGGDEISDEFVEKLVQETDECMIELSKRNNSFVSHTTPACLLTIMLINYVLGNILRIFWLGVFSFIFWIGFYASFLVMCAWFYIKYSKQHTEYLPYIDLGSKILWLKVVQPLISQIYSHINECKVKENDIKFENKSD